MITDIFFWISVVTTLLSVGLLIFSIWQYKDSQKEKEKTKAQVKVWMQDANGISTGLKRIVTDNLTGRFGTTNDVCNAI